MNLVNIKIKIYRKIALLLIVMILTEVGAPGVVYALTSGPSQPEVQSFEPVTTTEMVDLFSGDFTYNIPLFELPGPNGGYPFNLHYNSGITMDQEASWTGLGWNLNPGSITRQMRGLPDEYDGSGPTGDKVTHTESMKPNVTYGFGMGNGVEIIGGDSEVGVGLSLGASIYYNSYKGVGYSADMGLSVTQQQNSSGVGAGVGLNFSMDSQEGIGVNASLSMTDKHEQDKQSYSLGIGFNSHSGASITAGFSTSEKDKKAASAGRKNQNTGFGGSSTLSFHSLGYSPNVGMPMTGKNITVQFKVGGQIQILSLSSYINGFYNSQELKYNGMPVQTPAYGYLNLHKAGTGSMMDFNREGEGMIRKTSPNLPIPSLTCDVYSVTAHGVAGMYRAFRNDVTRVHDPHVKSETFGGALGVEATGGLLYELGGDVSVNYSKSESGGWDNGIYSPVTSVSDKAFEHAYFKTYGEHTTDTLTELNHIGKERPVRVKLANLSATSTLEDLNGLYETTVTVPTNKREPRNVVVSYVNNNPKDGMFVTNADGSRYYYKKAENTVHIECLYSSGALNSLRTAFPGMNIRDCGPVIPIQAEGSNPKHDYAHTNEYLKKTSMPAYAYAYLIEYIVGPDYVDVDGNGVSEKDMGYWVKFNYNEPGCFPDETDYTDGITYKWRVPFAGANYIRGMHTTFEDDKGSYTYGEKKIYYLTSVQSKTHVAKFYTSRRKDARGAAAEIQNPASNTNMTMNIPGNLGAYSRKLDSVALFSKLDLAKPIKSVHFEYDYSLCNGLHNNVQTDSTSGKLTLKKVWFTYQKNSRGSLSPYTFEYEYPTPASIENPTYNPVAYDRWGNYKPLPSDTCGFVENPYVTQFAPGTSAEAFKQTVDANMAVWNLKQITLPSGATINVQYEADDYAYVQNKRATQMFKIASLSSSPSNPALADPVINHSKNAGSLFRKVYFDLEIPIDASQINSGNSKAYMARYTEGLDKLYFKVYMHITDGDDNKLDYVSGYVDIEECDIDFNSQVGSNYTRGVITMGKPRIGKKNGGSKSLPYHPFSMAAWQYIRTDNPTLTYAGSVDADPNDTESAAMSKVKSMSGGNMMGEIKTLFRGFHDYAFQHTEGTNTVKWGDKIVLGKSFIKLNSPDKIKYGGGCRVKKITLNDQWSSASAEASSEYGQVYDYTIKEGDTEISSGVASYEPAIGGDENALKYAKEYVEAIPLKTNNKLFFEYPINESYYPAASVGYRKVKVRSLATYQETILGGDPNFPAGILTTGATVHEFFTAKEFPVVSSETPVDINFEDIFVPIFMIGQISSNKLTASQGYCTILNDMHGKLRKVTNYRQDAAGNIKFEVPDSYVEYLYNYETIKVDSDPNHDYCMLKNEFATLRGDKNGIADRRDGANRRLIGQDYEFFVDSRESYVVTENGGLRINTDGIYLALAAVTIPGPWPNIGRATTRVNTMVTNKIIHKSGIQIGTIAYDGGSKVKTLTVLFDDLTGEPLLTRVTNEFDDPIFNYDIPAYFAYNEAGPAYKNMGITVTVSGSSVVSPDYDLLIAGDELVCTTDAGNRLVYVNDNGAHNCKKLGASSNDDFTGSGCTTYSVIRSGRRNLLNAKVGNIKTLGDKANSIIGDPTIQGNRYNFQY